jgi:hypothetical protein
VQLDVEKERCLEAIRDIVASPAVGGFVVGYTAAPIAARRRSYRGEDFRCLVMLTDHATRDEALDLEGALWETASKFPKWGKTGNHRRSAGGVRDDRMNELIHGVYLAWW